MNSYNFKKGYDSYGDDIGYYPKKSIEKLIVITNNTDEAVGFNSLGYIKKTIKADDKLEKNEGIDIYINKSKIEEIINRKKIIASGNLKKDITFVITTCKRFDLFKNTMDKFLFHCQDIHSINNWLCLDDNSSEEDRSNMVKEYPFFNFIWKTVEQKGHAKSLNMLFDLVKTKYIFMFEDDWECSMNFYIDPYIRLLNEDIYNQVLFHTVINDEKTFKHICTANTIGIYEYQYSSTCSYKKNCEQKWVTKMLDIVKELDIPPSPVKGFMAFGWSLNPSIFNFSKIKSYDIRFKDTVEYNDSFELYFSAQCLKNGFRVAFTKIHIEHSGEANSAYILNGLARSYEIDNLSNGF